MFFQRFQEFLADDRGTATAEYAVVATIFGLSLIYGLGTLQHTTSTTMNGTQARLQNTAISLPVPQPT